MDLEIFLPFMFSNCTYISRMINTSIKIIIKNAFLTEILTYKINITLTLSQSCFIAATVVHSKWFPRLLKSTNFSSWRPLSIIERDPFIFSGMQRWKTWGKSCSNWSTTASFSGPTIITGRNDSSKKIIHF